MGGSKIMTSMHKTATIIDSYLFFQTSLANFPQCKGVNQVEKGYHPYLFTDINYTGPIVDQNYFDLKNMNKNKLQKFQQWYESWVETWL